MGNAGPNPSVNADVPGTFVRMASRSGGMPVTLVSLGVMKKRFALALSLYLAL